MYLPAGHKVGIYIDRIYRVGYADDVVIGEYVPDIACVALGTVVHELIIYNFMLITSQILFHFPYYTFLCGKSHVIIHFS